jgi:hypothetical protein
MNASYVVPAGFPLLGKNGDDDHRLASVQFPLVAPIHDASVPPRAGVAQAAATATEIAIDDDRRRRFPCCTYPSEEVTGAMLAVSRMG